ncbi:unnamed protein product, partial [Brassica oleracea var. botrytis]
WLRAGVLVGVAINVFPLTCVAVFSLRFSLPKLKDKARREVRDRTDVGSSAPSSFAAEVKGAKKKTVPNKCGRCRVEGHNRTNCTAPI